MICCNLLLLAALDRYLWVALSWHSGLCQMRFISMMWLLYSYLLLTCGIRQDRRQLGSEENDTEDSLVEKSKMYVVVNLQRLISHILLISEVYPMSARERQSGLRYQIELTLCTLKTLRSESKPWSCN
jgi:hypothetical protein